MIKYILFLSFFISSILSAEGKKFIPIVGNMDKQYSFNLEIDPEDNTRFISIANKISLQGGDSLQLCQLVNSENMICTTEKMKTIILPLKENGILTKNDSVTFTQLFISGYILNYKKIVNQQR